METTTEDGRGPLYCLGCGGVFERVKNGQCDECRREGRKPNHRLLATLETVRQERDELREALDEFADHQSWRCGHPDRYPWDPDCPCGLTAALRKHGLEVR